MGEVGGFLGPFSVGFVADRLGSFDPALGALAAASLVTALVGYVMDEPSESAGTGSAGD